jgi:hypothetical protein
MPPPPARLLQHGYTLLHMGPISQEWPLWDTQQPLPALDQVQDGGRYLPAPCLPPHQQPHTGAQPACAPHAPPPPSPRRSPQRCCATTCGMRSARWTAAWPAWARRRRRRCWRSPGTARPGCSVSAPALPRRLAPLQPSAETLRAGCGAGGCAASQRERCRAGLMSCAPRALSCRRLRRPPRGAGPALASLQLRPQHQPVGLQGRE